MMKVSMFSSGFLLIRSSISGVSGRIAWLIDDFMRQLYHRIILTNLPYLLYLNQLLPHRMVSYQLQTLMHHSPARSSCLLISVYGGL